MSCARIGVFKNTTITTDIGMSVDVTKRHEVWARLFKISCRGQFILLLTSDDIPHSTVTLADTLVTTVLRPPGPMVILKTQTNRSRRDREIATHDHTYRWFVSTPEELNVPADGARGTGEGGPPPERMFRALLDQFDCLRGIADPKNRGFLSSHIP